MCALVETSKHHGRCTYNSTLAKYAIFEFKYLNCGFFGGLIPEMKHVLE
jgi:hypothetical protein